jgi:segregation and condensation protein A
VIETENGNGAGRVEEPFEDERPDYLNVAHDYLLLDLEGFEGPIDVLLALARDQKVDLTRISILQLADQYLDFISKARSLKLEIAADYLVMAAWLAYLKSRLLLPDTAEEEEPSAAEMAARLAFQLQRLEAMRECGARLMERPRLGRDFFKRGAPEHVQMHRTPVFDVSLYDLLTVYGAQVQRRSATTLTIDPSELLSMEDALRRLSRLVGQMPDWTTLQNFLPEGLRGEIVARSALASTFAAALELVRTGRIVMRQSGTFGPIYLKDAGGKA